MAAHDNDCCQTFADSYDLSQLPAMRRVEQGVLGCDYGGTSWTTRQQALLMIDSLDIGRDQHLLDIGSGSGWPALFVADQSGCGVTLVDIPLNALGQARDRAEQDGLAKRVSAVAASGAALPFDDATFDVVSHSDVLCCLPEKLEMLRECRRVIKDGAISLFSVIWIPAGLSAEDYDRAIEAGPPFIDAPGDYGDLLASTGWRVTERSDVTPEYRQSLVTLIDALRSDADLLEALGEDKTNESIERRQEQVDSIDAGLLRREILLATAS
ncbi:MAG: class I SAM-dependent methyltransferase [Woeseiaceae bacterium]